MNWLIGVFIFFLGCLFSFIMSGVLHMNWLIGVFIFFLGCLFSFIVSGVLHMNWEDEDED